VNQTPSPRALIAQRLLRLVLGMVFVWAGGLKIMHPAGFFVDLLGYQISFPVFFLRLVAVCMPWLEVFCGIALLLDLWQETVRPVVSVLCLIFVFMLGQAVVRGLNLNCGCFGDIGPMWLKRPEVALVRASLLLLSSIWITVA
jgi:hypothetical protein